MSDFACKNSVPKRMSTGKRRCAGINIELLVVALKFDKPFRFLFRRLVVVVDDWAGAGVAREKDGTSDD